MNALPRLAPESGRRSSELTGPDLVSRRSWPVSSGHSLSLADGESAWVTSIRSGDVAAFEAMFRAYYEPLHAFAAAYVRDGATADELVQDVLCWVWEHRLTWAVDTSLKTYLFGAVRNRALNYARRQRIVERWQDRTEAETRARPERLWAEPADARAAEDDFVCALRRAVQRLPRRCRETYLLRWMHHLSYREIAARMGTSEKTVEFQIAKALKLLRRGLADFF
jgi:RNA polymerase sigma-70 factor, ECF subfamily